MVQGKAGGTQIEVEGGGMVGCDLAGNFIPLPTDAQVNEQHRKDHSRAAHPAYRKRLSSTFILGMLLGM